MFISWCDSPVVLSLFVGHDAVHSSFQGSSGKSHHLIQDPKRKLVVAIIAHLRYNRYSFLYSQGCRKILHLNLGVQSHFLDPQNYRWLRRTFPPVYLLVRYLVIAALPFNAATVMPGLVGRVVQTGPRQ